MRIAPYALFAAACLPLAAQDVYPHHNITFNVGGARPAGEISSFMNSAPAIGFSYGYRFFRYAQADIGLNMFFGAANVQSLVDTGFGPSEIKDREYMIPVGGRGILPLLRGRLLLSAGAGVAYLRYSDHLVQPNGGYYGSIDCPLCTSRSGWGGYGLLGGSYFLDHDEHFRVGIESQLIRAHTNGDALGTLPGTRTSDHWNNIMAEVGFSF